jgi:hypothetical protein
MTTLHITADSPEARKFIAFAKTLPFVEEKKPGKEKAIERIPGFAYTREERIASVLRAEEEFSANGISFSQENMERWVSRL